jgi:hypothetical protein
MALNFENIKGNTFEAVNFEVKINTVAVSLVGATIKMQLRKECGGVIGLTLTSVASAGITITDAALGKFKINKQIIDIAPYNYYYDIEIKFADNTVKTWVKGMFNVFCNITR